MREKRNNFRVEADLKMSVYEDKDFKKSRSLNCEITNIGQKGLNFVSFNKFNVGEKLYMRFELMGGLEVSFLGEILWKKKDSTLMSYGVNYCKIGWLSQRNLENGFLSKFKDIPENKTLTYLKYILLMLLVVLMSRFLNNLPLTYTVGIFLVFLGACYYIAMRTHN